MILDSPFHLGLNPFRFKPLVTCDDSIRTDLLW